MVSLAEKRARAKLEVVALRHGMRVRGLSVVELIARLKRENLNKEDVQLLKEVCEFHEVSYEAI